MIDLDLKIIWSKTGLARLGLTCYGRVGTAHCFTVFWDSTRAKGSVLPPWSLTSTLPGIDGKKHRFDNLDDAKLHATTLLAQWFTMLGATDGNQEGG